MILQVQNQNQNIPITSMNRILATMSLSTEGNHNIDKMYHICKKRNHHLRSNAIVPYFLLRRQWTGIQPLLNTPWKKKTSRNVWRRRVMAVYSVLLILPIFGPYSLLLYYNGPTWSWIGSSLQGNFEEGRKLRRLFWPLKKKGHQCFP